MATEASEGEAAPAGGGGASSEELEKLKSEHQVDLYYPMVRAKLRRPQFISTMVSIHYITAIFNTFFIHDAFVNRYASQRLYAFERVLISQILKSGHFQKAFILLSYQSRNILRFSIIVKNTKIIINNTKKQT